MASKTVFDRTGHPNRSWDRFGILAPCGCLWGLLGDLLGLLGPPGVTLGPPWDAPGPSWGVPGRSLGGPPGPPGSLLGRLGPQGSILDPPGVDLGSILDRFGDVFGSILEAICTSMFDRFAMEFAPISDRFRIDFGSSGGQRSENDEGRRSRKVVDRSTDDATSTKAQTTNDE